MVGMVYCYNWITTGIAYLLATIIGITILLRSYSLSFCSRGLD